MRFLLRRLGTSLLQLAAVSVLAFVLFGVAPGDFFSGESFDPGRSQEAVAEERRRAGVEEPWARRYGAWAQSCLRGEFGVSLAYGVPVGSLLAPRVRATLAVAMPALMLAWVLGLALALAAQARRGQGVATMEPLAVAAALMPDGITVSLLLWGAVRAGLPIDGMALPVAGLTIAVTPVVFLHAGASLAAARQLLFVRLARQRGVGGARLWLRYILPAAANPLVSLLGLSVTATIGASLLVEALTGWPGLGPLFLEAVQARDFAIVQAVIVLLAAVLTVMNLVVDLALYRLDPRIRTAG